jgi:hypothetical protein
MRTIRHPARWRLANVVGFLVVALVGCGGGSNVAGTGGVGTPGSGGAGPTGTGGSGVGGAGATGSGGAGVVTGSGGAASGGAGGGMTGSGGSGGTTGSGGSAGRGGTTGRGGAGGTPGSGGATGTGGAAGNAGPPIVDLFNGTDLTGFDTYRETAATSPGTLLTAAQAQLIFKVETGTIHVYGDALDQSTQARHTMVTKASYTNYNLWWEYKWGTKKFAPYQNLAIYPRDAGVLWHIHNDRTQVWPSSIEFQNKDGTTGDIFALYAQCRSLGAPGMPTVFAEIAAGGTEMTVNGSTGFVQHGRNANFEIANDWNALIMQVNNGAAVYTVNGHVVNRVLSVMDTTGKPVTSGYIAFQAEHAEVFYRNIRIQVLP